MLQKGIKIGSGYVTLVDVMGTDLTPINAAKASFKRRSDSYGEKEERLKRYLIDAKHLSVFRHNILTFEIKAPLMVTRQLQRYITGCAHDEFYAINEASYRYVTDDFEFYIPSSRDWRGAPDNKKQGSKGYVDINIGGYATSRLADIVHKSVEIYNELLELGIAPEQARLVLPAYGMMITWWMTISLQGLFHLLNERLDSHAMEETRWVAEAMQTLAKDKFPRTFEAMEASRNV